jgi:hypothetical protein
VTLCLNVNGVCFRICFPHGTADWPTRHTTWCWLTGCPSNRAVPRWLWLRSTRKSHVLFSDRQWAVTHSNMKQTNMYYLKRTKHVAWPDLWSTKCSLAQRQCPLLHFLAVLSSFRPTLEIYHYHFLPLLHTQLSHSHVIDESQALHVIEADGRLGSQTFASFYGTRRFITVFMSPSLSWTSWI